MDDLKEGDLSDQRQRLSAWEEQCFGEVDEAESRKASQLQRVQKNADQKLWTSFQNTASAIAQLYKDRLQDADYVWQPFQTSALNATNLYKDSIDSCTQQTDLAIQCGIQRRNKELLSWVKKKKRLIRREDLISYICGRSPPHRSTNGVKPPKSHHQASINHFETPQDVSRLHSESDLKEFQQAVAMHGLHGAMAGISVHSRSGGQSPQQNGGSRYRQNPGVYRDLTSFIADEFRRRRIDCPSTSRRRSESPPNSVRKRHAPRSPTSSPDCHTPKRTRM